MAKPLIFLDLDGVLVDLHRGFAAYHDMPYPYSHERRATNAGPDEAFEEWLFEQDRWEDPAGACTEASFWLGLQPFPWTRELYAAAKSVGDVYICSNPGRGEFAAAAAAGKMAWCQKHLGINPQRIILMADKFLVAGPGRILVDDRANVLGPWIHSDGIGLLFPQPYNVNHHLTSMDPVMWFLDNATTGVSA